MKLCCDGDYKYLKLTCNEKGPKSVDPLCSETGVEIEPLTCQDMIQQELSYFDNTIVISRDSISGSTSDVRDRTDTMSREREGVEKEVQTENQKKHEEHQGRKRSH